MIQSFEPVFCLYATEKERKTRKKEKYYFNSTIDWEIVAESKRESQSRVENITELLKPFSFLVFCQLLIDLWICSLRGARDLN